MCYANVSPIGSHTSCIVSQMFTWLLTIQGFDSVEYLLVNIFPFLSSYAYNATVNYQADATLIIRSTW